MIVAYFAVSAVFAGFSAVTFALLTPFTSEPLTRGEIVYALLAFVFGAAAVGGGIGLWRKAPWTYLTFGTAFIAGAMLVIVEGVVNSENQSQSIAVAFVTLILGGLFVKYVYAYTRTQA